LITQAAHKSHPASPYRIKMYFSYFEKGYGQLYFQALYFPFTIAYSEKIPEACLLCLN
jgi:hypothetical protein